LKTEETFTALAGDAVPKSDSWLAEFADQGPPLAFSAASKGHEAVL